MLEKRHLIRDIEVLRALAVMFTVFSHRQYLLAETRSHIIDPYLKFWSGVDLFFVISGFVIARGLVMSWKSSDHTLDFTRKIVAFWIRRIWRIWPTAWVWLAIALLLSATRGGIWGNVLDSLPSAAGILSGTQNFHEYFCENSTGICDRLLGVYWSLSTEEQFYLLFPLLLPFLGRKYFGWALGLAIVVQVFTPRPQDSFLWWVRCDGLLIGVAIALSMGAPKLRHLLEPVFLAGNRWGRYICTAMLLFVLASMTAEHVVPFGTGMIAVVAGVLVWFASFDKHYILPEGIMQRVLVWVGSRSYGIYIIHLFAFNFTKSIWHHVVHMDKEFGGQFTLRLSLTALALVVVLAEANYRLLENPLRRRGNSIAGRFLKNT